MDNIYVPRPGSNVSTGDATEQTVGGGMSSENMTQASHRMVGTAKKKEKVEKISKFGLYTLIYSVFTAFCLYKNARGITFPFYALSTIVYFDFCLKKMEAKWTKKDMLYPIAIILLGISVFLTDDKQMTGLAKWTIFILIGIYSLHVLYDETEWKFMRYIQALVQLIGGSVENIVSAYTESFTFFKGLKKVKYDEEGNPIPRKNNKLVYVGIGILVSIPLVAFILMLLCKADAVFKEAVDRVIELIDLENIIGVLITILLTFTLAYAFIRYLDEKSIKIEDKDHHVYEPVLAITVTSIISVIYLLFCGVQVVYLTFGNDLKLPEGYTYAEYAHEGFYELMTVCIINLIIVLVASYFFGEHKALKVILTIICACTYIMLASSAYRMYLYVREYDFTKLRVFVLYGLFVLAILLVGVIIYVYKESFPLFRYGIAILSVAIIILVYSHPAALIAKYNISQMTERHRTIDLKYLRDLGTDAAPVILENFDELFEYELAHTDGGINGEYSTKYNKSYDYDYENTTMYRYYMENFTEEKDDDDWRIHRADPEDYDSPIFDMSFRSFNLSKFFAQRANKATDGKYDEDGEYWEEMIENYFCSGKYGGESI